MVLGTFGPVLNPTVLAFDIKLINLNTNPKYLLKKKYKYKYKTQTNPITNPNLNNKFQSMKLQEFNQFHLPLKNTNKINFQIFYFIFFFKKRIILFLASRMV